MADAAKRMVPPRDPDWYVVRSGEHAGRPHLPGWILSAILGAPAPLRGGESGAWLGYDICPRCLAMVPDEKPIESDLQWGHERWHARTDYPIPAKVLAKVDPAWRDMYRHPDGQP